jgi:hypothetical protein
MRRALLIVVGVAMLLPVSHLAYDRYYVPGTPTGSDAWPVRLDALARAQVMLPAAASVAPAPLPPAFDCRYEPEATSGTTPKFDCTLASGETVKVKYGPNPEIPAEIAATRLLSRLGFAADDVSLAARVRCFGCPRSPYRSRQMAEWFFLAGVLDWFLDFREYAEFTHVAVERKLDARAFEIGAFKGWGFYELPQIDPARGGASRDDVDALRLVAVFLAHWDNKTSNQRLVCLEDRRGDSDAPCGAPLVMLQDLGATFGPRKTDYLGWRHAPLWRDAEGCAVSMQQLPYRGATFSDDVVISEGGRRLVADRLGAMTRAEIEALFLDARFPDPDTRQFGSPRVGPWADVFQDRVAAIRNRAC